MILGRSPPRPHVSVGGGPGFLAHFCYGVNLTSVILAPMKGGSIIRDARRRAGLTQDQLARRLGTSQSAIARWESGAVSPTLETLSRVVEACGLSLTIILGDADDHDLGLALTNTDLTPQERLEQLISGIRFTEELRNAGRTAS